MVVKVAVFNKFDHKIFGVFNKSDSSKSGCFCLFFSLAAQKPYIVYDVYKNSVFNCKRLGGAYNDEKGEKGYIIYQFFLPGGVNRI